MQKDEIEKKINSVLKEEFEINSELLVRESNIKDDLRLDSLDAVDLLVVLEEELEIEVKSELFMACEKLGDVYDVVFKIYNEA